MGHRMKFVFLGAVILAFIGMISYMIWSRPVPQIISVDIALDNDCNLPDHNFVITDLKTQKYHTFSRGHAKFKVLEGTPLKLALHPQNSKYAYDGIQFSAVPTITVSTDCFADDAPSAGFQHLSRELSQ